MTLRLAIFGQARFGKDVTERLTALGHEVVGVWAPPDDKRPDPLAELAAERGWPLYRHGHFRRRGEALPELVAEYRAHAPDLNVLPFATTILPPEIALHPEHGSVCFHPSLLPAYRGGAALSWQIILGESSTGVSVFRIGQEVDSGPLVVQRGGVTISPHDTMASLYFDKLYPLGVEAMVEAVEAISNGTARYTPQSTEGASSQALIDSEAARIDWNRPATEVERLIRGCDPAPGAWALLGDRPVRLFGGGLASQRDAPPGTVLGMADEALEIATGRGAVRVARLAYHDTPKQPAAQAGIAPGARFA